MTEHPPTIVWFRRDLRIGDHAALTAALDHDGAVIPVFIRDAQVDGLGAAPKWRLGQGLAAFDQSLRAMGSQLVLRSGDPAQVLRDLVHETGARVVYWSRAYDPISVKRDKAVKNTLKDQGVAAQSFTGHLLFEPWTVATKQGGFYRVYSPFWRAVRDRHVPPPLPAPQKMRPPQTWPRTERLGDWHLGRAMDRGGAVVAPYLRLGEQAARHRLDHFSAHLMSEYSNQRDVPSQDATSGLSENLSLGEISPAQCWHAGLQGLQSGAPGAETYLKEVVWREFAYHLMWHTPHILTDNWKPDWDAFPWSDDETRPEVLAWKQGRTGIAFVDAGMRELQVTGRMHNRVRMITGAYLTKHLMTDWRVGLRWFQEHLIDWDPAANAMGWQWVAGCGPDAAPYFRVFNPDTQREKFDPHHDYVRRWIAELAPRPEAEALSFFDAIPKAWQLSPDMAYPAPVVDLKTGRARALAAYESRSF